VKQYKVWIQIEEIDETGESRECDTPGAALETFETETEAYEFAEEVTARAFDIFQP